MTEGKKKRIVEKDGQVNVTTSLNNRHFYTRYNLFRDPVGTVAKWNFFEHLLVLLILCLVPWVIFALIWHLTFWLHGDLEENNLPDKQEESGWTPCVYAIHDFASSFLFSLETQRSIGYGLRGTSHKCTDSVILEMLQSICALLIECVIGVVLYIKLTRGLASFKTAMFSQNAVVSLRNGKMTLMFRAMNVKQRILGGANYTGYIVHKVTTAEGEIINHHFTRIQLSSQVDGAKKTLCNKATPMLPDIVSHTIDTDSPLFNISPDNIMAMDMEIIVSVVVVEPNGSQSMFLTSYLPDEIIWSSHFANCVVYKEEKGIFMVDVDRIDSIIPNTVTLWISAQQMEENNNSDMNGMNRNGNSNGNMNVETIIT